MQPVQSNSARLPSIRGLVPYLNLHFKDIPMFCTDAGPLRLSARTCFETAMRCCSVSQAPGKPVRETCGPVAQASLTGFIPVL